MEKTIDKHMFDRYNNEHRTHVRKRKWRVQEMKRRSGRVRKERRLLCMAVVLVMAICLCTAFGGLRTVNATAPDMYKYYTHLTVEEGDSLWDIAGRYMGHEYKNRAAYIKEVRSINHLNSSRIYAGSVLVVPYFDTVKK